jgi:hypothetical protein
MCQRETPSEQPIVKLQRFRIPAIKEIANKITSPIRFRGISWASAITIIDLLHLHYALVS